MAEAHQRVTAQDGVDKSTTALCLSGGGIRSAAFSIGVLQAVDEALGEQNGGKTRNFRYLSTVSGGGFAGAWYRALLERHRKPDAGLRLARARETFAKLIGLLKWPARFIGRRKREEPGTVRQQPAAAVGRPPTIGRNGMEEAIRALMEKGGYLDRSSAELVLVFLGRLLLFWLFAIPALWTALLLSAGTWRKLGILAGDLEPVRSWSPGLAAILGWIALLLVLRGKGSRRWFTWTAAWLLVFAGSHYLLTVDRGALPALLPAAGLPAAALALVARLSPVASFRWLSRYLGAARTVGLAAWLCLVLLVALLAWALDASQPAFRWYFEILTISDSIEGLERKLFLIPLLGSIAIVAGLMPARWTSLAEFYREAIRSGFKLGSLRLENLAEDPHLVVNAAASVDERIHRQWDERKAAAFAWCPDGHLDLRDIRRRECRFAAPTTKSGVELARAVATSAAVAGPRMGSYTARPIGLLLSLFNIRLGQWFDLEADEPFVPKGLLWGLVWAEIRGRRPGDSAGRSRWVHLTDGGHFENLGLYEMVRRRCDYILVVDAGSDPEYRYSDLANAIRKIRIDLGVEIEIDGLRWPEVGSPPESLSGSQRQRVYGGTIRYPEIPGQKKKLGQIAYVKPALTGDEPADVAGYADLHPRFPHEATSDQWFSESQFESYRRLGEFTIRSALQHYEDAKQLARDRSGRRVPQDPWSDVAIVAKLREAGSIAGRSSLRPTHGGALVCFLDGPSIASSAMRFLLVKSTEGDRWVFPKGHIEPGESPLECARRELEEEAGITWDESDRDRGVVYERYPGADGEVRCLFYIRLLGKTPRAFDRGRDPVPKTMRSRHFVEFRPEIWVTPEEYALSLREGGEDSQKAEEAVRRREGEREAYPAELREARVVIPELLWILQEAERQVRRGLALAAPAGPTL